MCPRGTCLSQHPLGMQEGRIRSHRLVFSITECKRHCLVLTRGCSDHIWPCTAHCAEQGEPGGIYCLWVLLCIWHRLMRAEEMLFRMLPPSRPLLAEGANCVMAQGGHPWCLWGWEVWGEHPVRFAPILAWAVGQHLLGKQVASKGAREGMVQISTSPFPSQLTGTPGKGSCPWRCPLWRPATGTPCTELSGCSPKRTPIASQPPLMGR